ncbi:MAG: adenylate/guanylate cyclase domain-containing protein [Verrucomicrobia bacterium]|nr:adenylate/guanylate cyclase domain-containing protein [Verrucomicrobiota bacterium]
MIRRTEWGTRLAVALVGAGLTVLAGYVALFRPGEALVSLSYDMPFIVHRPGTTDELRIVYLNQLEDDLEDESLDRRPQAKLLDKLGEAGAKAVVYDIVFDRKSKDPAIDLEFAEAIRKFRGVDAAGKPIAGLPQRHVMLACGRRTFTGTGHAIEQLVTPTEVLMDAVEDDFGLVAWDDDEFIIRKLATGSRDEPSLIWQTAIALGTPLDDSSRLEPRWLNFVGPPADPSDRTSSGPIPSCAAESVLLGGMSAGFFHDKVVVIGGEPGIIGMALGKDLFSTPFHRFQIGGKLPLMSGVEVQANGLANLLQRNWLTRSSRDFDLGLIIVSGILAGAGLTLIRPIRGIITAVVLMHAAGVAGVLAMHFGQVWFPWSVVAFLQVPAALVWGIAARSYVERYFRLKLTAEQVAIRGAFAKYLSPQMLDRLTAEGFNTNLGGEKVQAAMMFTDLEAFTDMCERIRDPQRIVETLNDYFERTTGSIFDDDGVIIKFIGDSIFAAWGAPLADPQAPIKAVRAAWKLYESDRLMVDGEELKTRIGLHFGEVVAGNVGSSRRVDYTLIGDAVNLASRLEGLNKLFDTCILMSDAVRTRLNGEFRTRRVGKFCVKGRKEFTVVHELLGHAREAQEPEWITIYHQALDALDQNDTARALELFAAASARRGPRGDGPSRFFIERLQAPEPICDGVVDIKEK